MKAQLLIPAAGMGERLGGELPKALVDLAGMPLLCRTLARFHALELQRNAVVVVPPRFRSVFQQVLERAFPEAALAIVDGGDARQDSVDNGLAALDPGAGIVVIHDAARPFVPLAAIRESIAAAKACGAATVAIPAIDTVLQGDDHGFLESTPDRRRLWACQTPQTFRVEVIRDAHRRARAEGFLGTDDASLVRRLGGRVKLVPGSPLNFKITTPADLAIARLVVQEQLA